MLLSEAVRDFCDYSRHEAGHARKTFYCYRGRLREFARWLEEQGLPDPDIHDISKELVRRWAYSLSARRLRPRTIRGAVGGLRALFTYLVREGAIREADDPSRKLQQSKMDAARRDLVANGELALLLEAAGRQRTEFRCVRDRAVFAVLIYCGLRRQELLDLQFADLNLETRSLLVQQGKGKKSRVVPLCTEVIPPLREWLATRQALQCRHPYLVATSPTRRLGERMLVRVIGEVKAIAGLRADPRITPHAIRHAAATRQR